MNDQIFRGWERIRTAVQGFADLCLTARPPNHFQTDGKYKEICQTKNKNFT